MQRLAHELLSRVLTDCLQLMANHFEERSPNALDRTPGELLHTNLTALSIAVGVEWELSPSRSPSGHFSAHAQHSAHSLSL